MPPSNLKTLGLLLVATASVFIVYFRGIGIMPLVGSDEPRYAEVAREMWIRHDLVTPTLGGYRWFEKPALPYWAEIAGFSLFGVSEWSARLGAAGAAFLTVLLVYVIGRRVEKTELSSPKWLGRTGALVLSSCAGSLVFSHVVNFDIFVEFTMTIALGCFLMAELEPERATKRVWLAGFYAGCGLALLAKGLIGIVLPFGALCGYYLLRRQWPRKLALLWGVPLMVTIAAIWYMPVILENGWSFIDQFIIQHHFARYLSNKYHHPAPFYYYLPVLLALLVPWTPFLVSALLKRRTWRIKESGTWPKFQALTLSWTVVTVGFFSFSQSKLPGYILPCLPAVSLLAGRELAEYLHGEGGVKAMRCVGLILIALAFGGVVYQTRAAWNTFPAALLIVAPAIISGAVALVIPGFRLICVGSVAISLFIVVQMVISFALPQISRHDTVRELIYSADASGYGSSPVFNMHNVERSSEFYAAGRVAYRDNGEPVKFEGVSQVVSEARSRGGWLLVIIPSEYAAQLTNSTALSSHVIGSNGPLTLIAVMSKASVG